MSDPERDRNGLVLTDDDVARHERVRALEQLGQRTGRAREDALELAHGPTPGW